ncbi:MAG: hypothetical protein NXH80_10905 [Rhodobacteraceae bacterium]|nr:hypothetical protein [Paracoccaceae bacterium]
MIGKLLKSVFMLGFYAAGLCGVVGTWDYTHQAKVADYEYSFEEYKISVMDRYGAEAEFAFSILDMVVAGTKRGVVLIDETGLLAKVGISLPERFTDPLHATSGSATQIAETVVLASASTLLAPEVSLYPRARVLQ